MQGDRADHLDQRTRLDLQAFDDVELIQLRLPRCHSGQGPARRWGRTTDASLRIQGAPSLQDAVDRPFAGHSFHCSRQKLSADGGCAVLAQVALLAQLAPQLKDPVLQPAGGPTR